MKEKEILALILYLTALALFIIVVHRHWHKWLAWTKVQNNGYPLWFSGAFGFRTMEISVCATCGEVRARLLQTGDIPK
jgi:hypothetical protein